MPQFAHTMVRHDDWEMKALCARFRALAQRWALDTSDVSRLLLLNVTDAESMLEAGHVAIDLDHESETRLRLAIEIDNTLRRSIRNEFMALVWLRLGERPSRLMRMAASLPAMRAIRREAEGLVR